MATLISTFTHPDNAYVYSDIYMNFSLTHYNGALNVNLRFYKDRVAHGNDTQPIYSTDFIPLTDDFNTYFSESELKSDGKSLKSQVYQLINTIDPAQQDASYPLFPADIKNDGIPSLSQSQIDAMTWQEADEVYNETDDEKQTYTNSVWVAT